MVLSLTLKMSLRPSSLIPLINSLRALQDLKLIPRSLLCSQMLLSVGATPTKSSNTTHRSWVLLALVTFPLNFLPRNDLGSLRSVRYPIMSLCFPPSPPPLPPLDQTIVYVQTVIHQCFVLPPFSFHHFSPSSLSDFTSFLVLSCYASLVLSLFHSCFHPFLFPFHVSHLVLSCLVLS